MLKQFFEYIQELFLLGHQVRQNQKETEELRRELQRTNALVIERAQKFERLAEKEKLEREKVTLQLENTLLRFERLLPPPSDKRR